MLITTKTDVFVLLLVGLYGLYVGYVLGEKEKLRKDIINLGFHDILKSKLFKRINEYIDFTAKGKGFEKGSRKYWHEETFGWFVLLFILKWMFVKNPFALLLVDTCIVSTGFALLFYLAWFNEPKVVLNDLIELNLDNLLKHNGHLSRDSVRESFYHHLAKITIEEHLTYDVNMSFKTFKSMMKEFDEGLWFSAYIDNGVKIYPAQCNLNAKFYVTEDGKFVQLPKGGKIHNSYMECTVMDIQKRAKDCRVFAFNA